MKRLKRLWWVLPAVLVVAVAAFVLWASAAATPMPQALAALETDAQVTVDTDPWLVFRPVDGEPSTGLVLYPGGRVDPRAYAPAARAIAGEGYLVAIVPMPLNLAFFAAGRAAEVMDAFPDVQHWAVGGHSLGGAMAANFVAGNPGAVDGLVLWAAYPAGGDDLSGRQLAVASVYGTRDGLATPEEVAASRPLLPPDAVWTAIEGGNHAGFGWYGPQSGDSEATISREEQQAQVVAATVQLLR
ncbi:MAG: alpha/beta hydrolase, partial [Anaerolineae bacterium]